MEDHEPAVASISARVRQFHESQTRFRIYHGSTNCTRRSDRRLDNIVDTSPLNHVFSVDKTKKTIVVEPNVPLDALVEATLKHGLVPPVVMEFPKITVGGGFSGSSGESSSFRYGAFDATVNWIEIVLANGEVRRASKTEKPDLFWGAASGFGTFGVVTLLEVQLIDARTYVQLTYSHVSNIREVVTKLQEESSKTTNDYVDAIVFSLESTILCTGRLVDTLPDRTIPRRFSRSRDPWFYVHAQKIQKRLRQTPDTVTDFVPLVDYLFRYNRGGFWVAKYAFDYFITPFNRITRFLLDPFMHIHVMYRAMHHSGLADFYMAQDVGIPYDKSTDFALWLDSHLHLYPLWLCPLHVRRDSPNSHHGLHSCFGAVDATENPHQSSPSDLLNFGVWGPLSFDRRSVIKQNRALEEKVSQLGGKKWLYAHAYYTEDEFWAHYDRKSYDALREKYSASYLPSVYDKVKVEVDVETKETAMRKASWKDRPLRGLYGVYKVIVGGDYLLQKPRTRVGDGLSKEKGLKVS